MAKTISPWESNYLQRQAAINGYARKCWEPKLKSVHKLLIYHPDEHRRYLRNSPCTTCAGEAHCDQACEVYLQWYNAKLEAARKLLNK